MNYCVSMSKSNSSFNFKKLPLFLAGLGILGGALGTFLGEIQMLEEGSRFFNEENQLKLATAVWFALVLSGIGILLAASQGIQEKNFSKAGITVVRSLPFFVIGGAISGAIAQWIYESMLDVERMFDAMQECGSDYGCTALDNVIRPARAVGWMIAGGLGGIALGGSFLSKKRIQNGLIGGLVGGLIGGLLFDSIDNLFGTTTGFSARLIAIILIGALMGGLIGAVDSARADFWITVLSGEMSGQQFIIYDQQTTVGCARNIPITLLHDRNIAEHHLQINKGDNELTYICLSQTKPVYVNGHQESSGQLSDGDILKIGDTELQIRKRNASSTTSSFQSSNPPPVGNPGRPDLFSDTPGAPVQEKPAQNRKPRPTIPMKKDEK